MRPSFCLAKRCRLLFAAPSALKSDDRSAVYGAHRNPLGSGPRIFTCSSSVPIAPQSNPTMAQGLGEDGAQTASHLESNATFPDRPAVEDCPMIPESVRQQGQDLADAEASTKDSATSDAEDLSKSMFTSSKQVYDMPMAVIHRPIQSVLDDDKVKAFMDIVANGTDMTPIEVMHLEKTHPQTGESLNYYFAVGGCHRWAAHKRLGRETIPARLISVTEDILRGYFGASLNIKLQ